MHNGQTEIRPDPRATRLALGAIGIAFVVDVGYLLLALTSTAAPAAGPWRDVESTRMYLGLTTSDVALVAALLLILVGVTLNAARWPRLAAGLWGLAGLGALVAVAMAVSGLLAAPGDDFGLRAVLDSAGAWLLVSRGRLVVLWLLLALEGVSAVLVLLAVRDSAGTQGFHLLRYVLVLPLAWGVYGAASGIAGSIAMTGQDALFYLVDLVIYLAPAIVYATAAVMLVTDQRLRAGWYALLACGLALSAIDAFYVLQGTIGDLMIVPPYLTVVAVVQLVLMGGARRPAFR